jgi:hypothetical protein
MLYSYRAVKMVAFAIVCCSDQEKSEYQSDSANPLHYDTTVLRAIESKFYQGVD